MLWLNTHLDKPVAQILGDSRPKFGKWMSYVRDEESGEYLGPTAGALSLAFHERALKEAVRLAEMKSNPGYIEEEFESKWPGIWKEMSKQQEGESGEFYAIIDTGLMRDHPLLDGLIVGEHNFSSESDCDDRSGHGTMVASIVASGLPKKPRLLNLKVADGSGRATPGSLKEALEWVTNFAERNSSPVFVNISVGVYWRKWGTFSCRGTCEVCTAAVVAAKVGVTIHAAAGNTARKTCCPAMAGLRGPGRDKIFAVAQTGFKDSGKGNVEAPGDYSWGPLDDTQG
ncbi:S8 family serine peptidase [Streptomyces sp. SS7]|uniref:S8 family serine peptidase n=1 Tax=Streptomyces sp. SS7 TaxID=3108485 RepID=UPI0030EEC30E